LQSVDFVGPQSQDVTAESYVYIEIGRRDPAVLQKIEEDIGRNLRDLEKIVGDFPAMQKRLASLELPTAESKAELEWLRENFVLLGMANLAGQTMQAPFSGVLAEQKRRGELQQELTN